MGPEQEATVRGQGDDGVTPVECRRVTGSALGAEGCWRAHWGPGLPGSLSQTPSARQLCGRSAPRQERNCLVFSLSLSKGSPCQAPESAGAVISGRRRGEIRPDPLEGMHRSRGCTDAQRAWPLRAHADFSPAPAPRPLTHLFCV